MSLKTISDKVEKKLEAKREKARRLSIIEGTGYSVSEGFGMEYVTPYALEMNANNTEIGLLKSLPLLAGNLCQLFTIKEMWIYNRKKIVFIGVLVQSLLWLAMIAIGFLYFAFGLHYQSTPTLLIIVYTLLIMFGTATVPAWTSWMKDLVPEHKCGSYFGNRNRVAGIVAMISLLAGGFILDYFKQTYVFIGFIILFSIAFIGRAISAYLLTKQYEPEFKPDKEFYFTFWQFLKKMPYSNFGKFVLFYSLFSFAVAIASPFFAVYMLKDLGFSYIWFMIVILSETIIRLVFMSVWGKLSDKYGEIAIIKFCAKVIPLIPFLWFFSIFIFKLYPVLLLPYLITLQIISGIVWSGFDLASSIFIFDAVSREKMALCLAYQRAISNILVFVGSLIGGLLATFSFTFGWVNAILVVFLVSAIVRFVVAYFMLPKLNDVRKDVAEFKVLMEAEEKLKMFSPKHLLNHIHFKFRP